MEHVCFLVTRVLQTFLQEESDMQTALKFKKAADLEGCSSPQFGVPLLFGQHDFVRKYPEEWVHNDPQCATSAPQCSKFGDKWVAFRLTMCKPDSPNTMTHGKQSKVAINGFCLFQSDLAAAMIHTPYASCAVLVLIVIDYYCASVKLLKGCSIAMAEHRTWQTWSLGKDIPVEVAGGCVVEVKSKRKWMMPWKPGPCHLSLSQAVQNSPKYSGACTDWRKMAKVCQQFKAWNPNLLWLHRHRRWQQQLAATRLSAMFETKSLKPIRLVSNFQQCFSCCACTTYPILSVPSTSCWHIGDGLRMSWAWWSRYDSMVPEWEQTVNEHVHVQMRGYSKKLLSQCWMSQQCLTCWKKLVTSSATWDCINLTAKSS